MNPPGDHRPMGPPGGAPVKRKQACDRRTLARLRAVEETAVTLSEEVSHLGLQFRIAKCKVDLCIAAFFVINTVAIFLISGVKFPVMAAA